jgi:hypothetical protein
MLVKTRFLNSAEIDLIKNGKQRLYALGTILYVDVFRKPRFTNFCFCFDFNEMGSGHADDCPMHNGTDWNNSSEPSSKERINVPFK